MDDLNIILGWNFPIINRVLHLNDERIKDVNYMCGLS